MTVRQALRTIVIFSLAGVGVSIYSFFHNQGIVDGAACVIGEAFDCDVVNQSAYSKIVGIPVSLLGIIGYAFMSAAALLRLMKPSDRGALSFLLLATTAGLLFSLYLTSIEAFVLYAWCILCLTSQTIMLSIFLMTIHVWRLSASTEPSEA